ncbi:hypothetical protein [Collinsella intestinalis]|uniref:ParB/Sulfiredoxin domain-containing protein n=1 Tax=Collinsella intestinalis TaxID=147207 RepID=A0A414G0A3_9ACTN|nr:hypothetical protein [Collinsella intestinalis]RHD57654.1 hypothetical protein DW787_02125 [Collinsella intestinalis]
MNLLSEGIAQGVVLSTGRKEKHSIDGVTRDFDIYRIKTDALFYNDQNDRIATWVSEYDSENGSDLLGLEREAYNTVIEDFIVRSNPAALCKTQRDIALRGQLRPGIVLNDGRVIDGNRRLTCIRRIARDACEAGWFEAAILDDAVASDEKRIKLLELAIQIGEEERVAYDPVDRLVGVYRDVVKNHLITPAEYGKATGMKEGEVSKLVERAMYMEEFLEFCGAPEQYHLARALKVDGPLGEFAAVLKKWDNRRDKELIKQLMFSNIVIQPDKDITRYIRDFKDVAGTDIAQEFKASEQEAMSELFEKMGSEPLTREKVSDLRADTELVDKFSRAGNRAREVVRRGKLMDTPAKKSAECLHDLEKILPEMLDVLGSAELHKVRSNLCLIIDKTNELIGEIDARA